jgi:RNA polymerase sigma-70 factor (ECF subfamily)
MISAALPSPALTQSTGLCWREVLEHRDYLLHFARRKLHDPTLAEDVVHDVFEAVLGGRARFGGRSALRSWLVGILKHKLVDLIRDRVRYSALDTDEDENGESNSQQVCGAPGPDDLAEQRECLALVMARIQQLPEGLRDVMEWRVLNDEPTEVVCERLGISQDNLFVRLHRARKLIAPAQQA